jgi:methylation protein EvaC
MPDYSCLICKSEVPLAHSFGKMPIANGFLKPSEFEHEHFFELKVGFCPQCTMFQLLELLDREKMFHENYAFFSSTSTHMARHFQELSEMVAANFLLKKSDPLVVEIGCNDGILLRHFAASRIRHIGIEPSSNVAARARENGVNAISMFFDEECAHGIVKEMGKADVFLAANVMCHIPYLHSVVRGMDVLMKSDGVIIFEDPYLGDVVQKTSYDQIYDEHCFLFSLSSIQYLFGQYGFEIFDAQALETHGGSMRYYISRKGAHPVSPRLDNQKEVEKRIGLEKMETYKKFSLNCEKSRREFKELLRKLHAEGRRVVGYGATSKSTTVLNYCGITADEIEFISDTTPIKQGKFSPGVHIPVKPYQEFQARYPDYAVLFAWNHAREILAKEGDFLSAGGKWIRFVPKVEVFS